MKMKLLVLITVLFLGAVSARAEITFGLALSNPLIGSEDQARRFDAYLEKHLNDQVRVRVLGSEKELRDWIERFRQVDFGVFSSSYLQGLPASRFFPLAEVYRDGTTPVAGLVAAMGLEAGQVQKLRSVLAGMNQDPEGRWLLGELGISRLTTAATGLPSISVQAAPTSSRTAAPQAVSSRSTAPRPVSRPVPRPRMRARGATPQITFGYVRDLGPLASEARVRRLTNDLGARLGEPVALKVFSSEKMLYDWVSLYREVDLAVLSTDFVRRQAIGKLFPLVDIEAVDQARGGYQIVAGAGNRAGFLESTQKSLLKINRDAAGTALLSELGIAKLSLPLAQPPRPESRVTRVAQASAVSFRPRGTQPSPTVRPASPKLAAPPRPAAPRPPVVEPPQPVPLETPHVPAGPATAGQALPASALTAEMGGRWDDAILVYQQLLQQDPQRIDLWRRVADIQTMLGRSHQATLALLCAIGQLPRELPLYAQLAQAHSTNGQLQAALFALRRGLDLEPQNIDFLRTQGQLAYWNGDLELARESYFRILSSAWRAASP